MGEPDKPRPMCHFCGVIFSPDIDLVAVRAALEAEFGKVKTESKIFPFDFTDYYEAEMGAGLKKVFFAFEKMIYPDEIAAIKIMTNRLEADIAARAGAPRPVNLDPGYLDLAKMVLATTKDNCHRIYIGSGIYAEVTLSFIKGTFRPQEWTYPDYRKPEYIEYFNRLRADYKEILRKEYFPLLFNEADSSPSE